MICLSIASTSNIVSHIWTFQHEIANLSPRDARTVPTMDAHQVLDYVPLAAAAFAVPQFVPQVLKLRATGDTGGVSWSWAVLTSINNAAWLAYFALSRYWVALVPSSSATLLAGVLALMVCTRRPATARPAVLVGGWAALLVVAAVTAGRAGLGAPLTVAFALQVTPSIWTAYRSVRPTGVSRGTWALILAELSCWTVFGLHKADTRLVTLGITGVVASVLMLARSWAGSMGPSRPLSGPAMAGPDQLSDGLT
jgi:hypothetical protein